MKIVFLALMVSLGINSGLSGADDEALPFAVEIGGQTATCKAGESVGRLVNPVKSNAVIVVTTKSKTIEIKVTAVDANDAQVGATPAWIQILGTNRGTLAETKDRKKIAPGRYRMDVTIDLRTRPKWSPPIPGTFEGMPMINPQTETILIEVK